MSESAESIFDALLLMGGFFLGLTCFTALLLLLGHFLSRVYQRESRKRRPF